VSAVRLIVEVSLFRRQLSLGVDNTHDLFYTVQAEVVQQCIINAPVPHSSSKRDQMNWTKMNPHHLPEWFIHQGISWRLGLTVEHACMMPVPIK